MSSSVILRNWFQYSDRDSQPYNPTLGTTITTERLWQNKSGEINSADWRSEEWVIHSFLVPINQLSEAANRIISPPSSMFDPGWDFEDRFSFGDDAQYGNIQLYPLTLFIEHPITGDFTIEVSR